MKLYTDGGVILKNPSTIGGTWAWILVDDMDEIVLDKASGYVTPKDLRTDVVTNNQTELLAVIEAFSSMDWDSVLELRSDSEITLGRVFKNYAFNNIPEWMRLKLIVEKKRLENFSKFSYMLMDGHPTKEQVEKGTGKKGHVTSKWNVWCDKECGRQAQLAISELGAIK